MNKKRKLFAPLLALMIVITGASVLTGCGKEKTDLINNGQELETDETINKDITYETNKETSIEKDIETNKETDIEEIEKPGEDEINDFGSNKDGAHNDEILNPDNEVKATETPTKVPESAKDKPNANPTSKPTPKPTKTPEPAKGTPSTSVPSGTPKEAVLVSHDKYSHTFNYNIDLPNGGSIYKVVVNFDGNNVIMIYGYENRGWDFYAEYYGNNRIAFKDGWPDFEDKDRSEIKIIGEKFIKAYSKIDKPKASAKDTSKLKPSTPVPSGIDKGAVLVSFDEENHSFDYFMNLPNRGIVDRVLVHFGDRPEAMISGHDNLGRAFLATYYSDNRLAFSFGWPDLEDDDMDALRNLGKEFLITYGIMARPTPTPIPADPYMDAPSGIPSEAELISTYEFHHTFNYYVDLPNGGSINQVTVCFGELASYIAIDGHDNSGRAFSLDYTRGNAVFNTFGKPDLEGEDHGAIASLGDRFLDAYGL